MEEQKYTTYEEFQLSAELASNPMDSLRTVIAVSETSFLTATTNGRYCLWSKQEGEWTSSFLFDREALHGSKMLCLCTAALNDGTFASGGSDDSIHIFSLDSQRIAILKGHTGHVNSIAQCPNGDIVSGSYDGSAIVWRNYEKLHKLTGHTFGVEVFGQEDQIVTASGDRSSGIIKIWRNGNLFKTIERAHSHIIRRIRSHPLGFLTCANDGYVKLWSNDGDLISQCYAHPMQNDKDPFVYSVSALPSGFVSVGEDSTARIISDTAKVIQTIPHPAPIRDVAVFSNGDFVTVSGDGVARIWTCDGNRIADAETLKHYQEYMELASASATMSGNIDPSLINPKTRLQAPGARHGQAIVVDMEDKGLIAFQWDENNRTWEELGPAIGQAGESEENKEENAVAFDHIVTIDGGPGVGALKLGFNKDDDPEEVAKRFCDANGFDRGHVPDIVAHLSQFADPVARQRKAEQESNDELVKLVNVPCWKVDSYQIHSKSNLKAMEDTIIEFNGSVMNALDSDEMDTFKALMNILKDSTNYSNNQTFTVEMQNVVLKLIQWPSDRIVPVLDLCRVLMLHTGGVHLFDAKSFQTELVRNTNISEKTQAMLLCTLITNGFAKRSKSSLEVEMSSGIVEFTEIV